MFQMLGQQWHNFLFHVVTGTFNSRVMKELTPALIVLESGSSLSLNGNNLQGLCNLCSPHGRSEIWSICPSTPISTAADGPLAPVYIAKQDLRPGVILYFSFQENCCVIFCKCKLFGVVNIQFFKLISFCHLHSLATGETANYC